MIRPAYWFTIFVPYDVDQTRTVIFNDSLSRFRSKRFAICRFVDQLYLYDLQARKGVNCFNIIKLYQYTILVEQYDEFW